MIDKKLYRRVVLAGCGAIAPMHLQGIAAQPDIELVALIDPEPTSAGKMADFWTKLKGEYPKCYYSLDDLLREDKPDVVHICTPHHTHVPLAVQALYSGCAVLLEKPPAINLNELALLEKAQFETGIRVGVCFQNRYNPSSLDAWLLMRSGILGKVNGARAFVTWWRDRNYYSESNWRGSWKTEGGGVLINQAIHTLDLLFWLAGQPCLVEASWSNHHLKSQIEVEDTAEAWFELENGATAIFYATSAYPQDARTFLEISCENMILRLQGESLTLLNCHGETVDSGEQSKIMAEAERLVNNNKNKYTVEKKWYDIRRQGQLEFDQALADIGKSCWGVSHTRLITAFYQALAQDKTAASFPLSGKEATTAIKAVLGIYRSHQANTSVSL